MQIKTEKAADTGGKAGLFPGLLTAAAFLLSAVHSLTGTLKPAGSFGEFLNRIVARSTELRPFLHDYYVEGNGVDPLFLLTVAVAVAAAAVIAVICLSVLYRNWPVMVMLAAAETALQIWFPGSWITAAFFWTAWALAVLWMLSGGRGDLRRLTCTLLIAFLAAGCLPIAAGSGEGTSLRDRLASEEKAAVNLTQGDFSSLDGLQLSDRELFEITMSRPDSYYLKGFTGEVYTGSGWDRLDNETLAAANDLFWQLHQKNFYGYSQLGNVSALTDGGEENRITIRFLTGKSECLLLPYETAGCVPELSALIGDSSTGTAERGGIESYTFAASPARTGEKVLLKQRLIENREEELLQDYLLCEGNYRDFVYENDTALDDETEALLKELLGEERDLEAGQVKEKILKLFNGFTYSEEERYAAADGDFLQVFLENRCGYSVHFATAAALIFRYYGIPARYAEGCLFTPEDAAEAEPGQSVAVDASHAHAWAEYYEDGIGWVPFEATGPYIGVMATDDRISYSRSSGSAAEQQDRGEEEKPEQNVIPETEIMEHALWIIGGILLLIILLAAVLIRLLRKRAGRAKGLHISDDREAVRVMTAYILSVMEKKGLPAGSGPVKERVRDVRERFGNRLADEFRDVALIYEKAIYSGRAVTGAERSAVSALAQTIKKKVKKGEKHEEEH
ncbi:MAG: transglutaminase family protein [Emergencia sp.]